MHSEYFRLALSQGVTTIIGGVSAYLVVTPLAAKSLAYGGCIALASTLFLALRFQQGLGREALGADWALRQAYRTAIERFVWVVVMLAVGFRLLELKPLWMLAGFVMGQAVWLLVPIWMKLRTKNDN